MTEFAESWRRDMNLDLQVKRSKIPILGSGKSGRSRDRGCPTYGDGHFDTYYAPLERGD